MITLPTKPNIVKSKGNQASFEIKECYPGYGTTLGSALRRVLLSSLPGAAIISVKIKGAQHEFSAIPHIMEDVVQIILNLKQVKLKFFGNQPATVLLKVKGEKEVTAGDIKVTSEVEVVNPEMHIATLTDKKAELDMELEINSGLGYLSVEQQKRGKLEIGKIAIDAIFSPVVKVYYSVENMRVGDRTDYDHLTVNIETNGSITPKEAFKQAAQILVNHFKVFTKSEEKKEEKIVKVKKKVEKTTMERVGKQERELARTKVEELKISSRIVTALIDAGLKTAAGIVRKSEDDLMDLEGLGKKGVVEIKRALGKLGMILRK